ncbi:MAG: DUF5916 domain-containing protein [Vicinamibacterales bacterium]
MTTPPPTTRAWRPLAVALYLCLATIPAAAQDASPPRLRAGALPDTLTVNGLLDEDAWQRADVADAFTQTEPSEGATPSQRTTVRVLAGPKAIVIGVECTDDDAGRIVSYSVRRDAVLAQEDHVRVMIGPFGDGRSGYVFAVNPSGARFDALINPGGETVNPDWDGIWEAATRRSDAGWTAEIRIPIHTLTFKAGLREWQLNVERRIQRRLEIDRWASAARQFQLTQPSRAGVLTDLPDFSLGLGLTIRPALTAGAGIPGPDASAEAEGQPSLDISQRIGANLLTSLTVNTDFAETEVDTRRTNLTRFPLFFPEKRSFFLEGADIFAFGLGLNQDLVPFFSRRVGLVDGVEVPIVAGGKVNGRVGDTNLAALVVGTNDKAGVAPEPSLMTVARVKRNLWRESWVGGFVSTGDPRGRSGSWLAGADFTYATSHFRGDKNFLTGVWALATGREDLAGDTSAAGFKVDYPNDRWDIALTYKRIGRDFDPSLGFVPRRAAQLINLGVDNRTRIVRGPWQQLLHEFQPFLATDLSGRWESYRVFMAPINWRFRTGDRFEFNVNPTGERLVDPFEVATNVSIAPGEYRWRRYRLEVGTAQKRRLYTQLTYWFGGFYDGRLRQFIWTGAWNPTSLVTVEFNGERNVGHLAAGRFAQTLVGSRVRLNLSPDLSVASYVQYDTDSESIGVNTRLRWTFTPAADLFVVYNHNVRSLVDRWQLESNQLLVKLQYAFRL